MKDWKLPEDYQTVMPYLIVKNAAGLLHFMKTVFDVSEKRIHYRDDKTTVMHAEVLLSGHMIMFAESTEQWESMPASLFVYVENVDLAYRKALAEGATALMEPADQSYGRSCGVRDSFGNTWWITQV